MFRREALRKARCAHINPGDAVGIDQVLRLKRSVVGGKAREWSTGAGVGGIACRFKSA